MKVKELIAHLEMLPQDADIYLDIQPTNEDSVEYNEESNTVIINA